MLLILILLIGHDALIGACVVWADIGQVMILICLAFSTAVVKAMMCVVRVVMSSSSFWKQCSLIL